MALLLFPGFFTFTVVGAEKAGALDPSFNPGGGPSGFVWSVKSAQGGGVFAGGAFTGVNGLSRQHLVKFKSDGSVDAGFSGQANNWVRSIDTGSNGTVVIGGDFTTVNGIARNRLARLLPDGRIDPDFDPGSGATGAEGFVFAVAVQPDGKVLAGGSFTSFNGEPVNYFVRVNSNGSLDTEFMKNLGSGLYGDPWSVRCIALQRDGKILVGGWFTHVNGVSRRRIARIHTDGTRDDSFEARFPDQTAVYAISESEDHKILVGGHFSEVNGLPRKELARLNADGSLDTGFDPGSGANSYVESVMALPGGKSLIGGFFNTFNGETSRRVALLNQDGSLDKSFQADVDEYVLSIDLGASGLWIGGGFTKVGTESRPYIAKLIGPGGRIIPVPLNLLQPKRQAGSLTFEFQSLSGKSYILEARSDLGSGQWTALSTNNGTGTAILIEQMNQSGTAQFFRMRTE